LEGIYKGIKDFWEDIDSSVLETIHKRSPYISLQSFSICFLVLSLFIVAAFAQTTSLTGTWKGFQEQAHNEGDFTFDFFGANGLITSGPHLSDKASATYVNSATATPNTIDITYTNGTFNGKVALGIYEIRTTTTPPQSYLRLALSEAGNTVRPSDFIIRPSLDDRVFGLLLQPTLTKMTIH